MRRGWSGLVAATLAAATVATSSPAVADEWWPFGVLPDGLSCAALTLPGRAGAWPLPVHFPNVGIGLLTMPFAPAGVVERLPARIELRTPNSGFNEAWQFALVDGNLYVKAFAGESGWRTAPLPNCLRGRISAISVDRSRLVALVPGGRVYTLDLADQTPELWWWTACFGSPIWLDPTGTQVRPASRAWSFSWLDPEYVELIPFRQQGFWTDPAGKQQPVGGAGVTTVFVLSPDGNRIVILDPWLPGSDPLKISNPEFADDYSYELPGPLDGRFQAVNLSASGSTTFLINEYGDMHTRLWDFDISGADTLFFSYTYGGKPDRASAPTNFDAWVGQFEFLRPFFPQYTGIHLPPPSWVRQPKIPGEITSTISVHTTGGRSEQRELRVEGSQNGRTGFWHKPVDTGDWSFTPNDRPLTAEVLDNRDGDTSTLTMVGPTGVHYGYRDPAGWTMSMRDYDYADDIMSVRLCAADGSCTDLSMFLASTPRFGWQPEGLSDTPRTYHGLLESPQDDWNALSPALRPIVERITGADRAANIMSTSNTAEFTLSTTEGFQVVLRRS